MAQDILEGMVTSNSNVNSNNLKNTPRYSHADIERKGQKEAFVGLPVKNQSEETIYRSAIQRINNNLSSSNPSQRLSSSSEEENGHNISDEIDEIRNMFPSFPENNRSRKDRQDESFEDGEVDCQ